MITTITPLRRVAVTLAMTGVTAFGAVAIAPAAFADESTTVTESAPVVETAPEVVTPAPEAAPVVEAPAPVVETPAPAPVVAPPLVVIGKDGKPVKAPKVCTDKDMTEYAAKLAKANQQAAPLLKAAGQLRDAAAALRAQVAKLTPAQARVAQALATVGDMAASKLEAQAQTFITKVGGIGCITVTAPGGRF
jgi:hypothetical protein